MAPEKRWIYGVVVTLTDNVWLQTETAILLELFKSTMFNTVFKDS